MKEFRFNGKMYSAERLIQKNGFFIAINVSCEGKFYSRMLIRDMTRHDYR